MEHEVGGRGDRVMGSKWKVQQIEKLRQTNIEMMQ